MSEAAGKKEPQQPERRIIELGQKFHPFDPAESKVDTRRFYMGMNAYDNLITLDIEDENLKINLNIYASPNRSLTVNTITPFDPNDGYKVEKEDLSFDTRVKKLRQMESKDVDFQKSPLVFSIRENFASSLRNEEAGFRKETLNVLGRLRVQVRLERGSFEAGIWKTSLESVLGLWFKDFYPQDTGPLASDDSFYMQEGLLLHLTNDPEKLKQVEVRFVLVPENQEDEF